MGVSHRCVLCSCLSPLPRWPLRYLTIIQPYGLRTSYNLLPTFHDSEFPTHSLICSERKHVEEARLWVVLCGPGKQSGEPEPRVTPRDTASASHSHALTASCGSLLPPSIMRADPNTWRQAQHPFSKPQVWFLLGITFRPSESWKVGTS